jgi:hypothetical protein
MFMRTKPFLTVFALLLVISVIFTQCSKDGEAGPAGPAGPAGATGPAGPTGPKGDTGTANVIYSAWLDVTYAPDTIHNGSIIDTVGFYANITATKLTSAIINSGEMKVYMNFGTTASPDVVPLPYFDVYSLISITPDFLVQRIFLYSNANASTVTQGGQKYLQYRYILIPGTVSGRLSKPIDWNDYNKVKAYLGLTD